MRNQLFRPGASQTYFMLRCAVPALTSLQAKITQLASATGISPRRSFDVLTLDRDRTKIRIWLSHAAAAAVKLIAMDRENRGSAFRANEHVLIRHGSTPSVS